MRTGAVVALRDFVTGVYMKLPGSDPSPLLSVGCQRGLACVFLEQTRGVIIDLEATGDDDDDAG